MQAGLAMHSASPRVLKPGPALRVDLGLRPVRVEAKTHSGIDPRKPDQPGTRSTRPNPGETRSIFFFIFTIIKRVLLNLLPTKPLTPFFFPWSCRNIPGKAKQLSSQDNTFFLRSLLPLSTNKWSFGVV
jgi:hypothetical protein